MQYLGCTCTTTLFTVYLKFEFKWVSCTSPDKPTGEECDSPAPSMLGKAMWCALATGRRAHITMHQPKPRLRGHRELLLTPPAPLSSTTAAAKATVLSAHVQRRTRGRGLNPIPAQLSPSIDGEWKIFIVESLWAIEPFATAKANLCVSFMTLSKLFTGNLSVPHSPHF